MPADEKMRILDVQLRKLFPFVKRKWPHENLVINICHLLVNAVVTRECVHEYRLPTCSTSCVVRMCYIPSAPGQQSNIGRWYYHILRQLQMIYKQRHKESVCTTNPDIMACRGITYHVCPVSGCPSCADPQHRTNNSFDVERARCLALWDYDSRGFPGWRTPYKASRSSSCPDSQHYLCNMCYYNWSQHNDASAIPTYVNQCIQCQAQQDTSVHPHTRNRGNAAPANEANDLTEEERDTELWLSNWKKIRDKCTQELATANCLDLAAVMTVLREHCGIGKTKVAVSGFVLPASDGRKHHGLFVKGNCVVHPGDMCAVMCSNEERFDVEPTNRQSYHIQAQGSRKEYYVVFSINAPAMLIGAAANGHLHEKNPPSNAVYKQFNVVINSCQKALTVLVATAKILGNAEVIMDYGSGFGEDIRDPMPVY